MIRRFSALIILLAAANVAQAQAVREVVPPTMGAYSPSDRPTTGSEQTGEAEVDRLPRGTTEDGTTTGATEEVEGAEFDSEMQASPAPTLVNEESLKLPDVIASLYRSFPEIERARLERGVAQGDLVSSFGAYDTKIQGYTLSEPTGFYRNFRHGIGAARQTWWGGYLSAGYRVGRGDFQPWYKERETNEGGEFKLAMAYPLLEGRAIDPQRVAVFQASLAARAAEPQIQMTLLSASREAAEVYWEWVAAGARLQAQRELLALAKTRGDQFEAGFKIGKFAEVDVIFNESLIADRNNKLLDTQRKFRESGFKLSLFLRNETGGVLVPSDVWLPQHFPEVVNLPPFDFTTSLAEAVNRRPEVALIQLESRHVQFDRQLASNQMLPSFDFLAEASQDVGIPTSSTNDKGQFELVVGFQGELPIQRRKARGKIQSTSAKIAQLNQKLRFQRDKIGFELQAAYNDLQTAFERIEQAEIALVAAYETLERYNFAFTRGKSNLIYLNFLEQKANESAIKVVDVQRDWFVALARLQVALGLDPLEQAINIGTLPASQRPGPGNLPPRLNTVPEDFEADWEKHEETFD